jgi:hypothetical protein
MVVIKRIKTYKGGFDIPKIDVSKLPIDGVPKLPIDGVPKLPIDGVPKLPIDDFAQQLTKSNPAMAGILNQVQGLSSKGMGSMVGSMIDQQIYGYIEDVSEILCEHGIDLDKFLDVTHTDFAKRGIFIDVLMAKIVDDIKMILDKIGIGFLMPIDIKKVAGGIFEQLKTKGSFKCPLRFKAPDVIVNLNPPDIKKRANKLKIFLGLENEPGLLNTLMSAMMPTKEPEKADGSKTAVSDTPPTIPVITPPPPLPPAPPTKIGGGKRKTRRRSNK